uniref:Large ribosomal subunit protein bL12c n=1 Tax=Colacium vesiculosum TaxID=102910 RepID=I6NIR8_9EUGL|nr:ribosomal protein L2 [Colacium vesiculosum]
MSTNIDEIIEKLKTITLFEASELVKKIETTFDVSATLSFSSPINGTSNPNKSDEEPVEVQTEFEIVLEAVPSDKVISAIKSTRKVTGLGLKESKDLVMSAPVTILQGVSKEKSEEIKEIFEEAQVNIVIK